MTADVEGGHGQGEVAGGGCGGGARPRRVVGGLDVFVGHLAAAANVERDNFGDVGPGKNTDEVQVLVHLSGSFCQIPTRMGQTIEKSKSQSTQNGRTSGWMGLPVFTISDFCHKHKLLAPS